MFPVLTKRPQSLIGEQEQGLGFRSLGFFNFGVCVIYIARNFLNLDPWGHGFVREEEVVRTLRYINVLLLA